MLKRLALTNLTAFPEAQLQFGRHLNVVVGGNGAGKTHLLQLAYSVLAVSAEEARRARIDAPTKAFLQTKLAEKLVNVFRPESLGRLVRRKQGRERCDVIMDFDDAALNIEFGFSSNSKTEVSLEKLPERWDRATPVFLPTRELLTIFPNFVSVYEGHYLEFEETWRDTCLLLGAPLQRGASLTRIRPLLRPLETAMGGTIELDKSGRFYLKGPESRLEISLVAEGLRKIGMLARLVAAGALNDNGYLFWDEPEANLNPSLIRQLARSILALGRSGVQIFIATHSLFLLREFEILLMEKENLHLNTRFFGLHSRDGAVAVNQGDTFDDIGSIAALDEELSQSDRFLAHVA